MIAARRGLGIAAACIVAALASGAVSSACVLDLDLTKSCGDGYVDREAGEECDPADPGSYESACEGTIRPFGTAVCDPITCEIDNSPLTCHFCGDGEVDTQEPALEECDGGNFNGDSCPGGAGVLRCTNECKKDFSACDNCGNGIVEPELGEECDFRDELSLGTPPRPCAGDETFPGIPSPFQGEPPKPFASGTYQTCRDNCTWGRSLCSYCGDGVLDDNPLRIDPYGDATSQPEECDGDAFSEARLQLSNLWDDCTEIPNPSEPDEFLEGVRPNLRCNSMCIAGGGAPDPCCVRAGEACPSPGTPYADAGLECCWEYLHADEVAAGADPCETVFTGGMIGLRVCRPFGLATE